MSPEEKKQHFQLSSAAIYLFHTCPDSLSRKHGHPCVGQMWPTSSPWCPTWGKDLSALLNVFSGYSPLCGLKILLKMSKRPTNTHMGNSNTKERKHLSSSAAMKNRKTWRAYMMFNGTGRMQDSTESPAQMNFTPLWLKSHFKNISLCTFKCSKIWKTMKCFISQAFWDKEFSTCIGVPAV